jgi:hypothetical protein
MGVRLHTVIKQLLAVFMGKEIMLPSLPQLDNEHQWSINDLWSSTLGNLMGVRLHTVIKQLLAAFMGKEIVFPSLPQLDNEHQWSINDLWSSVVGNLCYGGS